MNKIFEKSKDFWKKDQKICNEELIQWKFNDGMEVSLKPIGNDKVLFTSLDYQTHTKSTITIQNKEMLATLFLDRYLNSFGSHMYSKKFSKDYNKFELEVIQFFSKNKGNIMYSNQFDYLYNQVMEHVKKLLQNKAKEYAPNKDRLENFKQGANLTHLTPSETCWAYQSKHIASISQMVFQNEPVKYEYALEKIGDNIAYSILLLANLIEEGKVKDVKDE